MPDKINIFTDGGSRGNPGFSACAFVIPNLHSQGFYLGVGTNNNAEYQGVLKAFQFLENKNPKPKILNFYLDSELVVKQLTGVYKIKDPNLRDLSSTIKNYEKNYLVFYRHIPREQNAAADLLVNQTLDSHQLKR